MATVTKPIALDESLNTTEATPRNIADVLAEEIGNLVTAVSRIAPSTTVSWSQIQQSGTKIAEITINGSTTDVYAPTGGGFSALLVITAGTGLTVTASKGGDTYTATETSTGTYEVSVDSAGTWTVSDGSNTATVAVSSSTTYYVTLSSVPDGRTVLPTDDVSIWLACGQRSEAYTTLSQVLADSTCLSALISDNNAMDYLVRSTTWASGVTADSSAMSYIGLNNYASNTLLADDTWCSAILLSDHVESVMNVKMPPTFMTGYSTPAGNGTVYGSSVGTSNGSPYYFPWKAFDGVISSDSGWENSSSDTVPVYLGYKLPTAKCLKGMTFINVRSYGAKDFTVQGSNDSSETTGFTDIKSFEIAETTSKQAFPFGANTTDYSNIRLYFTTLYNSPTNKYAHATEIKFYGRADI